MTLNTGRQTHLVGVVAGGSQHDLIASRPCVVTVLQLQYSVACDLHTQSGVAISNNNHTSINKSNNGLINQSNSKSINSSNKKQFE